MHAHAGQAFDVLHGTQVLGVHDVGAVLVLEGRHVFIRTIAFLKQEHLFGRRTDPQGRLYFADDIAADIFGGCCGAVLPAAGIGAAALVGVTAVEITR
ncbi:hypothetical protein D3C81_895020 [compost metagenome]